MVDNGELQPDGTVYVKSTIEKQVAYDFGNLGFFQAYIAM